MHILEYGILMFSFSYQFQVCIYLYQWLVDHNARINKL